MAEHRFRRGQDWRKARQGSLHGLPGLFNPFNPAPSRAMGKKNLDRLARAGPMGWRVVEEFWRYPLTWWWVSECHSRLGESDKPTFFFPDRPYPAQLLLFFLLPGVLPTGFQKRVLFAG